MKCDIFIRSYNKDCEWLKYCVKSIEKYAKGFNNVIITYPDGHDCCNHSFAKNFPIKEICSNGYIDQQLTKLSAHKYCNDDVTHILYVDSDACFTETVSPDLFMKNGLPIIYMTPYSSFISDYELPALKWKFITENIIGVNVEYEFMRRSPFLYLKRTLIDFQNWFTNKYNTSIENYVVSMIQPQLSEYNALGAYIYYIGDKNQYLFINTLEYLPPQPSFFLQNWSWGGLTKDMEKKLIEITS